MSAIDHGGSTADDLHAHEEEEVESRSAPRPLVVYEVIRREGEEELRRTWSALAWSGLAAGLSMGFSLVAQGLIRASLPDAPWRPLIVNFGYSVGFLIVILGRQQLFTENTLTPILPLLNQSERRDALAGGAALGSRPGDESTRGTHLRLGRRPYRGIPAKHP